MGTGACAAHRVRMVVRDERVENPVEANADSATERIGPLLGAHLEEVPAVTRGIGHDQHQPCQPLGRCEHTAQYPRVFHKLGVVPTHTTAPHNGSEHARGLPSRRRVMDEGSGGLGCAAVAHVSNLDAKYATSSRGHRSQAVQNLGGGWGRRGG